MNKFQFNPLKAFLFLCILLIADLHCFSQNTAYFDSTFTGYFRINSNGWTAGDATISVPLPDKRVLWLFGDSYIVNVDTSTNTLPCLFQVRNCMMVQDSVNLSHFKTIIDSTQTGVNRSTFKLKLNDTTLLWPGHGYVWKDTVYLFMERYSNSNMGLYYGEYIAKLHYPDLHLVGIYPVQMNRQYYFGRAVIADTTFQTLYIYGNLLNWIVWEPVLARCNINHVQGPWEYYSATGWTPLILASQPISTDPVSPGFSVFPYGNKYFLVTQENGYLTCGLGREIYSYESDAPEGPFINKTLLYTEESKFNNQYLLTYNAQAHPFCTVNNELLIGYNVNDKVDTTSANPCPSECVNIWTDRLDADSYRPKFIRVPMGIITHVPEKNSDLQGPKIFPNPVNAGGTINIRFQDKGKKIGNIRIFDPEGQDCGKLIIQESSSSGFLLKAPVIPGVYLLSIESKDNFTWVLKLIVI